ncbi:RagB/SusD family nutrient uptake outer membrane protein [Polaribacter haliotis]|uniref:RagB/SusD family nutrient uptake outer membrane protein n=1 Tax=Polaribacter haliotis TaxID=1888915 RepID=A0A7L8AII3_9FLAO|nr:RagB/SusD family nutrient uptake outer membrane protein [Polaribacter haliotis]QOD61818.1 RagB/SusD family nutrient uptake outer membrane protein [Polaribacter haliotis]
MKNITTKILIVLALMLSGLISCNSDDFLTEKPKDFLSPENSFKDKKGFEGALAHIYLDVRSYFYANRDNWDNFDMLGMDLDLVTVLVEQGNYERQIYNWDTFNADNGTVSKWWGRFYSIIGKTNVIIDRAEQDGVEWKSDAEKNAIVGEAKFLRAFAYRFLANMWGGVPIVLKETTEPKFDYVRATKEEVYQQCKEDLTFAITWMPSVDQVKGGQSSQEAAYTILTEVNIQLGDYPAAIAAANKVINGGKLQLMTARFGKYKDFKWQGYDHKGPNDEAWGDVYWDLFRDGNFNRRDGNMETIWNTQFDVGVEGGGFVGGSTSFNLERWWGPIPWALKDKNATSNFLKDTLMGRPVGHGLANPYLDKKIWNYKGDFDRDMRNSKYNIQRTHYWTNPASAFYGQPITEDNVESNWDKRYVGPYFQKNTMVDHYGFRFETSSQQKHDGGTIYKDWYIMRLPEVYLLRAEAHMLNGATGLAANDINAIRRRVNATLVAAGDVNIDLILDERARELHVEEFRLNTLLRTGKLVEYLNKYHEETVVKGRTIPDYINKWPIPNGEIERNKEALLEQNPGYNN